jgi:16S rRNA (cytosine967-C5)-methyltransferase
MGVKALGEKLWAQEIAALNQKASVILRTNTLKIDKTQLQAQLSKEGIETDFIESHPDALKLKERANVFITSAFQSGFFEVQDASSQLVADYLDVKPGMRVIDTCAGAGGKTLHLAALMENKGQIIATDIYESKLKKLKKRARRAGAHNISTRALDSSKVIKKLKNTADRVLIDAPCSGMGVLKRNPDSKWKLQPEFVENIIKTQAEILDKYASLVKKNGKLVYATCSILPQENEDQVKHFLANHSEFKFVKERKISAATSGFDGFYMALLERVD